MDKAKALSGSGGIGFETLSKEHSKNGADYPADMGEINLGQRSNKNKEKAGDAE
jgi:hypothetical protein